MSISDFSYKSTEHSTVYAMVEVSGSSLADLVGLVSSGTKSHKRSHAPPFLFPVRTVLSICSASVCNSAPESFTNRED